jgi:hypothetical protein
MRLKMPTTLMILSSLPLRGIWKASATTSWASISFFRSEGSILNLFMLRYGIGRALGYYSLQFNGFEGKI